MTVPAGPRVTMGLRDVILFAVCIIIFWVGAFPDPLNPDKNSRNLDPLPDAAEYSIVASNIFHGAGVHLRINDVSFPSRYMLGFPILIIPSYALFGNDPANAVYGSFALGLLSIAVLYLLVREVSRSSVTAFLATFFFAANPLVWTFSGLVMSEIATTFFFLLSLYALVRFRSLQGIGWAILLGCSVGYAAFIRIPNAIIGIPIIFYLLWGLKIRLASRPLAGFLIPYALFLGVILVQDYFLYGSLFGSGYSAHSVVNFGFGFLLEHGVAYFKSLFLGLDGTSIWLKGPFYTELVTVIAFVGVYSAFREKRFGALVVGGGICTAIFLLYSAWFYVDIRFFLPLFPLIFAAAAYGLSFILARLTTPFQWGITLLVVLVYFLNPLHPPASSFAAVQKKSSKRDLPTNYIHVQEINSYMERAGARRDAHFLVTSMNLVYQDYHSNKRYSLLPMSKDQEYAKFLKIPSLIDSCQQLLKGGRALFISDYKGSSSFSQRAFDEFQQNFDLHMVHEYLYGNARLYRVSEKNVGGN